MGVDISLHIEIRRQNQWHLMTFSSPFIKRHEHDDSIFDTQVFNCRYYHFREFIEDAASHRRGNKEILSKELQEKLSDEDSGGIGFGTFMFDDLQKHCDYLEKLLLSGITHAGIWSIKEQLDRIESKLVEGTNAAIPAEKREENYEETTPIEKMYEDFMWDYGCIFRLRDTVRALTSIGYTSIDDSNIRLFYLIC